VARFRGTVATCQAAGGNDSVSRRVVPAGMVPLSTTGDNFPGLPTATTARELTNGSQYPAVDSPLTPAVDRFPAHPTSPTRGSEAGAVLDNPH
jgi:hypothetical protein